MCCEAAVVSQLKNISLHPAKGNHQLLLNTMKLMRISDFGGAATPAVSKQALAVPDKQGFDLQWVDRSLASMRILHTCRDRNGNLQ